MDPGEVASRTRLGFIWRGFVGHKLGMIGAAGLILIYLLVILAPWIAPYGYSELDLSINDPGPSLTHPMGTQLLGQDELTRVLYGGRVTLLLALTVAALVTSIGVTIGLVSGYYGRAIDTGFMSLSDFALALPLIPLSLVAGFTFGFSPLTLILVLTLLLWPRMARLVRAEVLSVRNQEYVEASRALGVGEIRIMTRHLLPNVAGVVVVEATLTLAAAILTESALSFVAVFMCDVNGCFMDPGIKTGAQSLGMMLGKSIITMDTQWWTQRSKTDQFIARLRNRRWQHSMAAVPEIGRESVVSFLFAEPRSLYSCSSRERVFSSAFSRTHSTAPGVFSHSVRAVAK